MGVLTQCFPDAQDAFMFVFCGIPRVCTLACFTDWMCQTGSGPGDDGRCLEYNNGVSTDYFCHDPCAQDSDCMNGEHCDVLHGLTLNIKVCVRD